jgi:hypothetical protein
MDESAVLHGIELRIETAIKGLLAMPAHVKTVPFEQKSVPVHVLIKMFEEEAKPWRLRRSLHAALRASSKNKPGQTVSARKKLDELRDGSS